MHIKGLQKLTLLDYPGHLAATVFLGGCGFRCPFCHNSALVLEPASLPDIDDASFFSLLEKRRGILDGVAITGGEPLLSPDIDAFMQRIRGMGFAVKLDTNGAHPKALRRVLEAGLVQYVAMDIKNAPSEYARTVGLPQAPMEALRESVSLLMEGKVDFEFRTTLVKGFHTPGGMAEIGRWIEGAPHYFLQGFVDSGAVLSPGLAAFSPEEAEELRQAVLPFVPSAQLRGIG